MSEHYEPLRLKLVEDFFNNEYAPFFDRLYQNTKRDNSERLERLLVKDGAKRFIVQTDGYYDLFEVPWGIDGKDSIFLARPWQNAKNGYKVMYVGDDYRKGDEYVIEFYFRAWFIVMQEKLKNMKNKPISAGN